MTKDKLRLAVLLIPHVVDFCARTGISRRTIQRLREENNPHEPTKKTVARIERALKKEGIIGEPKQQQRRGADRKKVAAHAG